MRESETDIEANRIYRRSLMQTEKSQTKGERIGRKRGIPRHYSSRVGIARSTPETNV